MLRLAGATLVLITLCAYPIWGEAEYRRTSSNNPDLTQSVTKTLQSTEFSRLLQTPLYFIRNHGQMNEAVVYYAKSGGTTVYCTDQGLTFGFAEGSIRLKFSADRHVQPEGRGELSGKVNYFIGNNPAQWRTNIPTFQEVVYREVYPGIDVVYEGDGHRLKYTFYLQPGANPDNIQMIYEGVEEISIDKMTGELIFQMPWAMMQDSAPVAHQEIKGVRKEVDVSFRLLDPARVGFTVGVYDPDHILVLDPGYSTYLGGDDHDVGLDIAVDSSGNTYVMGATESTNFPTQSPFQGGHGGGTMDAFVTKFNSSGSALVYSTYLGGNGLDAAIPLATLQAGIAIDSSGNAYITGMTRSTNFPLLNAFQSSHNGGTEDAFVTKLDSSGSLLFSTYLGGTALDHAHDIDVDNLGNAYITGRTDSTTGLPTANGFQPTHSSGSTDDAFMAKIDTVAGGPSAVTYFTFLGGTGSEDGFGISVDSSGNAYVAGVTGSTVGFPIQGAFQPTHGGGATDAYVTKIDTTLTGAASLIYSTYLGGSDVDEANDTALDSSGNVYLTGQTSSIDFDLQNAFDSLLGGNNDAFVTKFNSSGSALVYSTYLGGSFDETGVDIAVDSSGNAYVTGKTSSSDFPLQNAFQPAFGGGDTDVFITKLDSSGQITGATYSTFLGGNGIDDGIGIAVNGTNAYVTGKTESSDFPLQNPFDSSLGGPEDVFVASYTADGSLPVELSVLTATITVDGITIRWRTESETNNLGFNVYRGGNPDGPFEKVTTAVIRGAGADGMAHDYEFTDERAEPEQIYYYYLEDIDFNGTTQKSDLLQVDLRTNRLHLKADSLPTETQLLQNFPNPFNPETWMPYALAAESPITVDIYDAKGQLIRHLDFGVQAPGVYLSRENAAYWNGKNQLGDVVSGGVYFYTLIAGDFQATRRMVIVK